MGFGKPTKTKNVCYAKPKVKYATKQLNTNKILYHSTPSASSTKRLSITLLLNITTTKLYIKRFSNYHCTFVCVYMLYYFKFPPLSVDHICTMLLTTN